MAARATGSAYEKSVAVAGRVAPTSCGAHFPQKSLGVTSRSKSPSARGGKRISSRRLMVVFSHVVLKFVAWEEEGEERARRRYWLLVTQGGAVAQRARQGRA